MARSSLQVTVLSVVILGLVGCGGSSNTSDTPVYVGTPDLRPLGDIIGLSTANQLVSFKSSAPDTVTNQVSITGANGETFVGIDYRPSNNRLYGLTSAGNVYTLDAKYGSATKVSTLTASSGDASSPYAGLTDSNYSTTFDPVSDQLRVIGTGGQNLLVNVDNGQTTTDTAIQGSIVSAASYTNAVSGTQSARLFSLNQSTNNSDIVITSTGALSSPVSLGQALSSVQGYDINGVSNVGYAVLTINNTRSLYTVNRSPNTQATSSTNSSPKQTVLTKVADFSTSMPTLRGITLRYTSSSNGPLHAHVYALSTTNAFSVVDATNPTSVIRTTAITGLKTNESIVGWDSVISTTSSGGVSTSLFGLSNQSNLYSINASTGAASAATALSGAVLQGTDFSVDVNPVNGDWLVGSDTGQNYKISGSTTSALEALSGTAAAPFSGYVAAFNNSYSTGGSGWTALYALDTTRQHLGTQPPSASSMSIVGPLGTTVQPTGGLDIAGGDNGFAYAAMHAGTGASTLYTLNLESGQATAVGTLGNTVVRDIAVVFE